jgi:pyruvate dehydrogenase E1 component alpha subunit
MRAPEAAAAAAGLAGTLPRELLLLMYERMTLIRAFEERLVDLMAKGVAIGTAHSYAGQEAVAVGVCTALNPDDWIASTHRGHGHCIAKGMDVDPVMAEIYGKVDGANRGKGGSMHITDVSVGMLGVNPIVGGGIPHAVGAALSAKLRKTGQVAATFFGDGGANIGACHESINLAAVWNVPCVFVCENNGYAQSTPSEWSTAGEIWKRAIGYGIPGEAVDGQDLLAVYAAVKQAADRARAGDGPSLIEARTYRYHGHYIGDNPHNYRLEQEEEDARGRDCIQRLRANLLDAQTVSAAEMDQLEQRAAQRIEAAVAFAEASPFPEPGELTTQVFAGE